VTALFKDSADGTFIRTGDAYSFNGSDVTIRKHDRTAHKLGDICIPSLRWSSSALK
jgi:hypothetical protein